MNKATQDKTAGFLIIGDEILSGRTADQNLNYLAKFLTARHIMLREVRVVPDEEDKIIVGLNALREAHDYVMTSGGIGPTHDDITSASIAKALGRPLQRNEAAVKELQSYYKPEDLNEARLTMADMPEGAQLIYNPISKAPGFYIDNVFVMAGVPKIFQAMLDDIASYLEGGRSWYQATISTRLTEGVIADELRRLVAVYPMVQIGSYPYFHSHQFGVSLVLKSPDEAALDQVAAMLLAFCEARDSEAPVLTRDAANFSQ